MTQKKSRKSLDDALAREFVYGEGKPEPTAEPENLKPNGSPDKAEKPKESNLMSRLQATSKEPTVRFTVDLVESKHRELSLLAARTGRKKADLVRLAIDELLKGAKEEPLSPRQK